MKKDSINLSIAKLFFIFCLSFLHSFSQISYEFGVLIPIEKTPVNTTESNYFGVYETDNPQLKYEINEKGIFVQTINIQSISKETIRETGKYEVRNEHIFGVSEDSIPCIFQDDSYYFGVRNDVQLIGNNSENKLIPLSSGSYILNFKTENGYTPTLIELSNNQLNISHFDYESESKIFKKIKDKQTIQSKAHGLTTIVLRPTLREWEKILVKELFGEVQNFKRN
jgi:hypothetical protein